MCVSRALASGAFRTNQIVDPMHDKILGALEPAFARLELQAARTANRGASLGDNFRKKGGK